MASVYTGKRVLLSPIFAGPERFLLKILRVDPKREQDWKSYAKSLLIFSLAGWLLLYVILRTQNAFYVPHALNPLGYHSAPWNVTFNTTSSFLTNTNWQYYSGETTMTYLSQMIGLTVQNWLSAGIGIGPLVLSITGIEGWLPFIANGVITALATLPLCDPAASVLERADRAMYNRKTSRRAAAAARSASAAS
jgi:K+-transporting ATPase ATPase A chain